METMETAMKRIKDAVWLDRLIAAILAEPETRPLPIDRPEVRAGIDRLLLEILGEPTI
jgi:hypothetical protein